MATKRVQILVNLEYRSGGSLIPAPANTPLTITDRDTSAPAIVWDAITGGSVISTPETDADGNVPGFVTQGSYQIVAAAVPGATPPYPGVTIDFEAVRGDGVENYAPGSIEMADLASALQALLTAVPVGSVFDFAGAAAPSGFVLCDGASYPIVGTYAALFAVLGYSYGGSGANFNVPDCRGRVSMGAGSGTGLTSRVLASKIGAETVTLGTTQVPAHGHTFSGSGSSDTVNTDHLHTVSASGGGSASAVTVAGQFPSFNPSGLTRYGSGAFVVSGTAGGGGDWVPTIKDNRWGSTDGNHSHPVSVSVSGGTGGADRLSGQQHAHVITVGGTIGTALGNASGGTDGHANVQPSIVMNKIIKY